MAPKTQASAGRSIVRGLSLAKAGDYDRAVDEWTNTWAADRDSLRTHLKSAFAHLVATAGPAHDYEIVRQVQVSNHVERWYVVLLNERDPTFLVLEAYLRPDTTWTIDRIEFNMSLAGLPPLDAAQFLRTSYEAR